MQRAPSSSSVDGISIHALREEGDPASLSSTEYEMVFLSTPSARRATSAIFEYLSKFDYFYPRPPRGGRHVEKYIMAYGTTISIHALREEGDDKVAKSCSGLFISIHALREEGDLVPLWP